jgi:hypothetical protein
VSVSQVAIVLVMSVVLFVGLVTVEMYRSLRHTYRTQKLLQAALPPPSSVTRRSTVHEVVNPMFVDTQVKATPSEVPKPAHRSVFIPGSIARGLSFRSAVSKARRTERVNQMAPVPVRADPDDKE